MGRMILVVEDDAIQASNITAYLTRNGWDVQSCSTAEEALGISDTLHPDAVVTDQRLPRMSGIEMMQKMREADPLLTPEALAARVADYTSSHPNVTVDLRPGAVKDNAAVFVLVEAPKDEAMDECARLRRTNGICPLDGAEDRV